MKCAYCDNTGKMSREHVIPDGFIEHMEPKKGITFLDKAPTKVINAEVTIKDVCSSCNNGYLSVLDSYALNLILKYNDKISFHTKKIQFKYNYDLLTRWLLKVCYNSARTNDCQYDVSLYEKNVDYIMNRGPAQNNIVVFVMFMGSEVEFNHMKKDRTYDIGWFRIGSFRILENMTFYCANRIIMINSFAFLIVVLDNEHNDEIEKIRKIIEKPYSKFVELLPSGKVLLKRDDSFLLDSLKQNLILRDNYMQKRASKKDESVKIIALTRKEIEEKNFDKISYVFQECLSNKDDLKDYYQSAAITIDGYQNENREPYQDKKLQEYSRLLLEEYSEIVWILDLDLENTALDMILLASVNNSYINDINDPTTLITINQMKGNEVLITLFNTINNLVNTFGFDYSYNQELTQKITQLFDRVIFQNMISDK